MADLDAVAKIVEESADIVRTGSHDVSWQATFETRESLVAALDDSSRALRSGDDSRLAEIAFWFVPTGPLCEIAASSGWLAEYTALGNRLDAILAADGPDRSRRRP